MRQAISPRLAIRTLANMLGSDPCSLPNAYSDGERRRPRPSPFACRGDACRERPSLGVEVLEPSPKRRVVQAACCQRGANLGSLPSWTGPTFAATFGAGLCFVERASLRGLQGGVSK